MPLDVGTDARGGGGPWCPGGKAHPGTAPLALPQPRALILLPAGRCPREERAWHPGLAAVDRGHPSPWTRDTPAPEESARLTPGHSSSPRGLPRVRPAGAETWAGGARGQDSGLPPESRCRPRGGCGRPGTSKPQPQPQPEASYGLHGLPHTPGSEQSGEVGQQPPASPRVGSPREARPAAAPSPGSHQGAGAQDLGRAGARATEPWRSTCETRRTHDHRPRTRTAPPAPSPSTHGHVPTHHRAPRTHTEPLHPRPANTQPQSHARPCAPLDAASNSKGASGLPVALGLLGMSWKPEALQGLMAAESGSRCEGTKGTPGPCVARGQSGARAALGGAAGRAGFGRCVPDPRGSDLGPPGAAGVLPGGWWEKGCSARILGGALLTATKPQVVKDQILIRVTARKML